MTSNYLSVKSEDKGELKYQKAPNEKKVGFARPTLTISPPPQSPHSSTSNPYNTHVTTAIAPSDAIYGRKPSQFVFDQINDFRNLTFNTAKTSLGAGEKCAYWLYNKVKLLSKKWFTHCFLSIILVIYTVGGAVSFIAIEGPHEDRVRTLDIRNYRYELIEELTNLSRSMPSENSTNKWLVEANTKMLDFLGKVIENHQKELFIKANRGDKVWTMWNAVVFCATIYTTIGYGHMYPKTTTGRALTIVYALIGIPLFLIALTDFGKLFTRCIKFLWSFVRRLYYTGSCRNVRKNSAVEDIFKGAQMVYEIATFRRPSSLREFESQLDVEGQPTNTGTPTSPTISNFEINDEFNLPISVALFILVAYIFCGAVIYMAIEKWNFFASFYFVFISMSTIGFGDYVPRHPVFMIGSIIYLVFGLALMSMCINVVQAKLSDTFKEASAKIGATIGLEVNEDENIKTISNENINNDVIPDLKADCNVPMMQSE